MKKLGKPNRVFLIVLVLAIISIIAYLYKPSITIQITQDGFIPDEVTVEENTVIEFKNIDDGEHWPASDIHPTHDIYPQFDPKKPIKAGESWKFSAGKAGTWKFHDHLDPHRKGILIVKGKDNSLKNNNSVPILGADYKNLQNIADEKGVEEVWRQLTKRSRSNVNLHDQAHFVGGLIYDKKGLEGLSICTVDFAFGCYHGLLDKAFLNGLSKLTEAEENCLSVGKAGSGPFASCIHGIGHGVASFFKTTDLENALSACNRLTNSQTYCHDGVFMEFERNAPSSFYKASNPLYPCDSIDQKYLSACGRNQPQVMLNRLNLSFESIPGICLSLNHLEFQSACFDALGFNVAHRSGGNPETIIKECNKIKQADAQTRCIIAAAGELIFQNTPGWQESTSKICRSIPEQLQRNCNNRLEQIIADYQRRS